MFFIVYVHHDESKLNELLDAWEKAGVGGVTILPSIGLGRINKFAALREDIPLIPSLKSLLHEHEELLNRTLFTIVDSQEMVDKIVAVTENIVGRLDDPYTGILAVLPVAQVYGLRQRK